MAKKNKFSGYAANKSRKPSKQELIRELINPGENIAFLDAEFNAGIDSVTGERICEIISVGMIICDSSYNGLKKYYSLVSPLTCRSIFPVISKMTGITEDMLEGQPGFAEVSKKIGELVKRYSIKKIYTWGAADKHSLLNEKRLIRELKLPGYQYASKWNYIDMCTDISEAVSSQVLGIKGNLTINMENLLFVCEMNHKQEHNALSDAYDLFKCMKYLKGVLEDNKSSRKFNKKKELVNQYYQDKSTYNSFRRFRQTSKGVDLYGKWNKKSAEDDIRIKALEDDLKFLKGEIPVSMEFDSIQEFFKKHQK